MYGPRSAGEAHTRARIGGAGGAVSFSQFIDSVSLLVSRVWFGEREGRRVEETLISLILSAREELTALVVDAAAECQGD